MYSDRGRNIHLLTGAEVDAALASRPRVCPLARLGACSLVPNDGKWEKGTFRRHLQTHVDKGGWWWKCSGLPVEDIGDSSTSRNRWTCPLDGRDYAGGCLANFSRKDSLKRHIRKGSSGCVGDVEADYHLELNSLRYEETRQLLRHCDD